METFIEHLCQTVFGWFCHQDPAFLNHVDGKPIWLCPRCCGLQLGLLFSFLAARLTSSRIRTVGHSVTLIFAAAAAALMADWFAGQIGWYSPSFTSRLLTGLATGAAAGILLLLYRRGMTGESEHSVANLRALPAAGLMAFAMIAGWITATQNGWLFRSTALILTVLANVLIVIHTFFLILRFRFGRVIPSQNPQT